MKKLLLSLAFFLPLGAIAQTIDDTSLRITTSPLPINVVTEPGKSITAQIKVRNDGNNTEQLRVTKLKFRAYTENGDPEIMVPEPGDEFIDWVTFSEDNFSVGPREWKTVTANFNVPETAAFGYYYAFMFSRLDDSVATGERQTAYIGGTAVLVLLEARVPNAIRQIELDQFSTDKSWYEFLPVKFSIRLKNSGNVHIVPKGDIFIFRGDRDIDSLAINRERRNILPDSFRVFEERWESGFPVYQQKVEEGKAVIGEDGVHVQELKWDFNDATKLRFGKYTAKMVLVYDDGQRDVPIEKELSFWVLPWRMFGLGFVISLFALLGIKSTVQKIFRRLISLFGKKQKKDV